MEPKIIDIQSFSDWLIYRSNSIGSPVSPLKLQKLLYYCQSWHLVVFKGHSLFVDQPEAWSNGPVYREVYNSFKEDYQRHEPIIVNQLADEVDKEYFKLTANLGLTDDQKTVIDRVLLKYSAYSDDHLVLLTHSEQPWSNARIDCDPFGICKEPISHQSMQDYYASRLQKAKA